MIKHYHGKVGFPSQGEVTAYVEPFLGGGAMLGAAQKLYPQTPCFVNDINTELINLYGWVKRDVVSIEEHLNVWQKEFLSIPVASRNERKQYYYTRRKEYWGMPEDSALAAALLFFLMKTGFNGIWQSCEEANGKFATPVGLAKQEERVYDVGRLHEWHAAMKKVEVSSGSYRNMDVPEGSFVFCDPPYRDSFTSYNTVFNDASQKELMEWCHALSVEKGCHVWLSNREAGDDFFMKHAIRVGMQNVAEHRFPITYTAGRRKREANNGFSAKKATELLLVWDPAR